MQFRSETKEYNTGFMPAGSDGLKNGSLHSGVGLATGYASPLALGFGSPTNFIAPLTPATFAGNLTSGDFSISVWLNPGSAATGVSPTITTSSTATAGNSSGFRISANNGSIQFGIVGSAGGVVTSTPSTAQALALGSWYHVVGTRDYTGSLLKLYVNNILIGSNLNVTVGSQLRMSSGIHIARDVSAPTNFFSGLVDELRVYNTVLTEAEVGSLYNLKPVTRNLFGYWPLGEDVGSISYDRSDGNTTFYSNQTLNGTIQAVELQPQSPVVGSVLVFISGTN